MPSSSQIRKSPTPTQSQQSNRTSSTLSSWDSYADIPQTAELSQLISTLRERVSTLRQRKRNLKLDETEILAGKTLTADASDVSLADLLDGSGAAQYASVTQHEAPTPSTSTLLAPPTPSKLQSASPDPRRNAEASASPAPSSSGQARPKIKIKRDPDRERGRSESVAASASTPVPVTGDESALAGVSSRRGNDSSIDMEWDEEGPARPGRVYQAKRKRQRASLAPDQDDVSLSDPGSPQPSVTSQRISSPNREPFRSSISSSIKLKLNPTTHTAPIRSDSLSGAIRRPSSLRGREDYNVPMTPMQASQAAMWELPKRTPDSFIPKPAASRPTRVYPTRPDDVDVDFAKMDWRERDKERDRLEAAAAAAAANGPGPGQAVVKESAAGSRGRDRKLDQVAHHTFQQWTDGWFRTLTEEDLAWLSSKPDELEAFQFPSLGRHYSEVWEEEEANGASIPTVYLPGGGATSAMATSLPPTLAPLKATSAVGIGANGSAPGSIHQSADASRMGGTPKFDPRNLRDDHLYGGSLEDARGGPFTERLLAALLPTPPPSLPDVPLSGGSADGALFTSGINGEANGQSVVHAAPGITNGSSPSHHHGHHTFLHSSSSSSRSHGQQDMFDYEERLRKELKAIDVLGDEEIDWSERADDEISSTLRKVQRLLRKQIRINEMRKSRLFLIAMDRMAYQDYLGCLNSVEREIETGWMKRQAQIKKSMQAQKKKKGSNSSASTNQNGTASAPVNAPLAAIAAEAAAAAGNNNTSGSPSTPGAAGMAQSASSMGNTERGGGPIAPQFSDALLSALEKRRQLRFAFEPLFAGKPLAKSTPKPDESIYEDLDLS